MASSLSIAELKLRALAGLESKFERLTPRETLRRAAYDHVGISRFGDGELRYCLKRKGIKFQPFRPDLADRLLVAILEPKDGVLTCFSHTFRDEPSPEWVVAFNPKPYDAYRTVRSPNDIGVLHRRSERRAYAARWNAVAKRTAIRSFGDTNFLRLSMYVDAYVAGDMDAVLDDFRQLFAGRRILFVAARDPLYGGAYRDKGRELAALGVAAAEFIDIPAVDAAAEEERIVREILAGARGMTDVFIQAGPFATVLAHELAGRMDARIIDSGALNAQVEYLVPQMPASVGQP